MNPAILAIPTPPQWVADAAEHWQELLLDHAACEKKAASTALALLFSYPEFTAQNLALARLAREELRHFERVTRLLGQLGVTHRRLQPGRYAAGLRAALSSREPQRHLDLLLIGALIEARSCERFALLKTALDAPLAELYAELERSEARHASLYLELAEELCRAEELPACQARLAELAAIEAQLCSTPDEQLRFHSGPSRASVCSSNPS
ncbi:MAG TPA: tRNA isopentenyl-2-thiomethyl-A-37 hydroxylase MiaE [Steroidobacteraceae bacterium]